MHKVVQIPSSRAVKDEAVGRLFFGTTVFEGWPKT